MASMIRELSSVSLGSQKKKNRFKHQDDDDSIHTLATDAPFKYKEASSKTLRSKDPLDTRSSEPEEGAKREERSMEEAHDFNASQCLREEEPVLNMPRSTSFRGLKKKMEKISKRAFHRRRQFERTNSLLDDEDSITTSVQSYKPDPEGNNQSVSARSSSASQHAPSPPFLESLGGHLSMNTDKQDELLASLLDGTAGCATTEAQLQSRLLMDSVASQLPSMTHNATSFHEKESSRQSLSEESAGFLRVLSQEMEAASPQLPKGQDDLVLFLGDELEASTCGRPRVTEGLGQLLYYDFAEENDSGTAASGRRMVPIKEGGAVEEMLESIEMGYEASLIGCGMAQ